MNNYCTKCGKKLDKDEIQCSKCGTAIVDNYKYINKDKQKKTLKTFMYVVLGLVGGWLFYVFIYPHLLIPIVDRNLRKSYNVNDVTVIYDGVCRECTGSCDGSCIGHKTIFNCFKYTVSMEEDNHPIYTTVKMNNFSVEKDEIEYELYGNRNYYRDNNGMYYDKY